uniref:Uncharacterized protein n=1 Tax=Acrobeloides nanus TaxID=290746 RepID=A0A914D5Z3_9BILA
MDTHKLWMEKVHQLMKTYSFQLEQCKQLARTAQRQQIQSMALGKKHKELIEAHKKLQKESDLLKTSVQFYKGEIENRGEEIGRLKQEIFELKNNRYHPASAAIPSSYSSAYAGNLNSDVQSHIPTFHGTRMTPPLETANTSVCDITISGTVSNTSMLSNVSTAYSNRSKDGSFRLRMDDTMNQREEHNSSNASMSTLFMLGLNSSSKRTSLDISQSSSSSRLSFSRLKKRPYYAPVVKPIW